MGTVLRNLLHLLPVAAVALALAVGQVAALQLAAQPEAEAPLPWHKVFHQQFGQPFYVAKDVCIARKVACGSGDHSTRKLAPAEVQAGTDVLYDGIFSQDLAVTAASPEQKVHAVPGSTILLTALHRESMNPCNIDHFAETVFPLWGDLVTSLKDFQDGALVWGANANFLFHRDNVSFDTSDWQEQVLGSVLSAPRLFGRRDASPQPRVLTCEDVWPGQTCFERLVIHRNPNHQTFPPVYFQNVRFAHGFRDHTLRRLGFEPTSPSRTKVHVLSLIRPEHRGWNNTAEAIEKIGQHVRSQKHASAEYSIETIILDQDKMTLAEQVKWWQRADIVVSMHGAHLANVLFLKDDSSLVEYFKLDHLSVIYRNLARQCGLSHYGARAVGSTCMTLDSCTRHFLDIPMPLNYEAELRPVMEVAMTETANRRAKQVAAAS